MTGIGRRGLASGALLPLVLSACVGTQSLTAPPQGSVPTYLWGIRKACRRDSYLSSAVEKRLFQLSGAAGGEVRRLLPRPLLENSTPKLAAAELRRNCRFERTIAPQNGLLLGGRVEDRGEAPPYTLMRLFRVDLANGELAYRDHFCRGCDIARTLSTQAAFFLEAPGETIPGQSQSEQPALPTFCAAKPLPPRPAITPNPDADRVSISVRGGRARPGSAATSPGKLQEALRQHVLLTGREVVTANAYYTLTVELAQDGGASVFVSSRGGRGEQLAVEKPRAAAGAVAEGISEALIDRVVRAAGGLLDGMVDTEVAAAGQKSLPLFELPLPRAAFEAMCQPRPAADCSSSANRGLDSDPSISQFFDPQCGELLEEEPPSRR